MSIGTSRDGVRTITTSSASAVVLYDQPPVRYGHLEAMRLQRESKRGPYRAEGLAGHPSEC